MKIEYPCERLSEKELKGRNMEKKTKERKTRE